MIKKTGRRARKRPEPLKGAPLQYAPEHEIGVVFLFSHLAKKYGIKVERVRAEFPDCIAWKKTGDGDKRVRIEFELRSRSFKTHKHSTRGCDIIVCWEHDWPDMPKHLQLIELRKEYGLGFNIWIQPVTGSSKDELSSINSASNWTVPSNASQDDLILYYHTRPDMCIKDIFVLKDRVRLVRKGWDWNRRKKDYMGPIKRVCSLKSPIFLDDMRQHRILKTAGFVRGSMQGRPRATEFWPSLFDLIVRKNPSVRTKLKKYSPDRI